MKHNTDPLKKGLDSTQYGYLTSLVNGRVRMVRSIFPYELTKNQITTIYGLINANLKEHMGVEHRNGIEAKDYKIAVTFIKNWFPNHEEIQLIKESKFKEEK